MRPGSHPLGAAQTAATRGKNRRLPWRERVARLQLSEGFSQWLVKELALDDSPRETEDEVFNKYSTHSLLRDRLAALPSAAAPLAPGEPGISLLAEPDALAEKMIAEIQRVAAEEEKKDSQTLARWSRKTRGRTNLRPLQGLGMAVGLVALIAGPVSYSSGTSAPASLVLVAAGIGLGIFFYRFGRYKDRMPLPVPDYTALKQAGNRDKKEGENIEAAQKEMEAQLRGSAGRARRPASKAISLRLKATLRSKAPTICGLTWPHASL